MGALTIALYFFLAALVVTVIVLVIIFKDDIALLFKDKVVADVPSATVPSVPSVPSVPGSSVPGSSVPSVSVPLNTTTPGCSAIALLDKEFGKCTEQDNGSWSKSRQVNFHRILADNSICNYYDSEIEVCPPENCEYESTEYTNCVNDKTSRTISISKESKYGGTCTHTDGQVIYGECDPVDCVTTYTPDGICTVKDGVWAERGKYQITTPAYGTGLVCKTEQEWQSSNPLSCDPIDCKWNNWVSSSTHFIYPEDFPLASGKQILGVAKYRSSSIARNGGLECTDALVTSKLDSSMFAFGGDSSLFHPFSPDQMQPIGLEACPSVPMTMTTMQYFNFDKKEIAVGMNTFRRGNLFNDTNNWLIAPWPMRAGNNGRSAPFSKDGFKVQFEPVDKVSVGDKVNVYKIKIFQASDTTGSSPQYIGAKTYSCGIDPLARKTKAEALMFVAVPVRSSEGAITLGKYYLRQYDTTTNDVPKRIYISVHGNNYHFCHGRGMITRPHMAWSDNDYGFVLANSTDFSGSEEVVWDITRPGECNTAH